MQFRVLGPLEVSEGSREVVVPPRLERALLARLLLEPGAHVGRDALIEGLWPRDRPKRPTRVLDAYLSRCRRRLVGVELSRKPMDGYVLAVDPGQVDVGRFAASIDRSARHDAAGELGLASAALGEALELWRSGPVPELSDWPDVVPIVRRLQEDWAAAVERRAELALALGQRGGPVIESLEALLAWDPLREGAWALLARLLTSAGRRADALRAVHRSREALAEVGLMPGSGLAAVEREVLAEPVTPTADDARALELPGAHIRTGAALGPFFGRAAELADVGRSLLSKRLVTIAGPGGIGKTRLAVEVAARAAAGYELVVITELAGVEEPAAVAYAVATAAGIKQQPGLAMLETLSTWLGPRRALIVLDNCEHVVSGACATAQHVLSLCGGVTVLATSREPLGLRVEEVHVLGPLGSDDEPRAAIELFDARARQVRADHDGVAAAEDVAAICRELDRVPLAIELAAARCRALTPAEIRWRIGDHAQLLTSRRRDDRHSTMQACVEWSYLLLEEPERATFTKLSVFASGWDLAAAEALLGAPAPTLLDSLADRSMITVSRNELGSRYRFLEPIRQYAASRLDDHDRQELSAWHARWFADLSDRIGEAFIGREPRWAVASLEADFGNLRAAHAWALGHGRLEEAARILVGLTWIGREQLLFEIADWWSPTVQALREVQHPLLGDVVAAGVGYAYQRLDLAAVHTICAEVEGNPRSSLKGRFFALFDDAWAELAEGRTAAARHSAHRAVELAARLGHPALEASALATLAVCARGAGDGGAGERSYISEAIVLAERSGSPFVIAATLCVSARLEPPEARVPVLRRALEAAEASGVVQFSLAARDLLAEALGAHGQVAEAAEVLASTLTQWMDLRATYHLHRALDLAAGLLAQHGQEELALAIWLHAEQVGFHTPRQPREPGRQPSLRRGPLSGARSSGDRAPDVDDMTRRAIDALRAIASRSGQTSPRGCL